jgi:hypothetical protein
MPSYSRNVAVPGKTAQELYDKVAVEIDRFLEKSGMGKFDVARDPAQKTISVKSPMFSAKLVCEDANLKLDGSLSLLAMPFKSKIDSGIDWWIGKHFPKA